MPLSPPTQTNMNTGSMTQSLPQGMMSQNHNSVTILPSRLEIAPFTGTDVNYSARKFIECCENLMTAGTCPTDRDKIRFIKSYIQFGSEAANAMDSSAFTEPTATDDYPKFRANFLEEFDRYARSNFVKAMDQLGDSIGHEFRALRGRYAQAKANKLVQATIQLQKDHGWMVNGIMTEEAQRAYLRFHYYNLALCELERNASLNLEYTKDTPLLTFQTQIRNKLDERGFDPMYTTSTHASSILLPTDQGHLSVSQSTITSPSMVATMPPSQWVVLTCHYCNKQGHTANVCFAKSKDKKKKRLLSNSEEERQVVQVKRIKPGVNQQVLVRPKTSKGRRRRGSRSGGQPRMGEPSSLSQTISHPTTTSPSPSSSQHTNSSKFCSVHNNSSHSTDECRLVKNLSREHQATGKSLGEGHRASPHDPT